MLPLMSGDWEWSPAHLAFVVMNEDLSQLWNDGRQVHENVDVTRSV